MRRGATARWGGHWTWAGGGARARARGGRRKGASVWRAVRGHESMEGVGSRFRVIRTRAGGRCEAGEGKKGT